MYQHPHYTPYGGARIWVGHELDTVNHLERIYGLSVLEAVYEIYKTTDLSPKAFSERLGFYIPISNHVLKRYNSAFRQYAKEARARIVF